MLRRGKRGKAPSEPDGAGEETGSGELPSVECPICAEPMAVESEQTLAEFGELDIKLHHLRCANCGMRVDRAFHPSVGYRAIAR